MASFAHRLAAVVALGWMAGCCGSAATATPCELPAAVAPGVSIASPALECPSHLCLVTRRDAGSAAVCTSECSSDHDCAGMDGLFCRTSYACAHVGAFPHSVCVCVE